MKRPDSATPHVRRHASDVVAELAGDRLEAPHEPLGVRDGLVSGQSPSSTSFSLPPTPNMSRSIAARIARASLGASGLDVRRHAGRRTLFRGRAEKLDRPPRALRRQRRRDLEHRAEATAVVVRTGLDTVVSMRMNDDLLRCPGRPPAGRHYVPALDVRISLATTSRASASAAADRVEQQGAVDAETQTAGSAREQNVAEDVRCRPPSTSGRARAADGRPPSPPRRAVPPRATKVPSQKRE